MDKNIELWDTFNGRRISIHRTLENAVRAGRKHNKAVKRANGASSYIPYGYKQCGEWMDQNEILAAKCAVDYQR